MAKFIMKFKHAVAEYRETCKGKLSTFCVSHSFLSGEIFFFKTYSDKKVNCQYFFVFTYCS